MLFLAVLFFCLTIASCQEDKWVSRPYSPYEYRFLNVRKNWQAQEATCVGLGGHLASVHSFAEAQFIASFDPHHTIWVGGNDLKEEGKWVFTDSSKFVVPKIPNLWAPAAPGFPAQPDNHEHKPGGPCVDDCLSLNGIGSNTNEIRVVTGRLFDNHCCRWAFGVCKRMKQEPWIAMPNTGYQYLWVDNQETYVSAVKRCEEKGGMLADVQSVEEASFLSRFAPKRSLWIGLHDRHEEGKWVHPNNKTATFFRWAAREPDSNDKDDIYGPECVDDCVSLNALGGGTNEYRIQTGYMFDNHCCRQMQYVCKRKDPNGPPPHQETKKTIANLTSSLEDLQKQLEDTSDLETEIKLLKEEQKLLIGTVEGLNERIDELEKGTNSKIEAVTSTLDLITKNANEFELATKETTDALSTMLADIVGTVGDIALEPASSCRPGDDCTPTVGSTVDGLGIIVPTGTIKVETSQCGSFDLCQMAEVLASFSEKIRDIADKNDD
eukprot:m.136107 g.136107  ORF g.136107 m.136107 type:complete len:493 (+) comp14722_c1_seq1:243-1721(+)